MKYMIQGVTPKALSRYFEEVSAIPRASGNEAGIADYLVKFAEERELFCYRDETNNVFIKKPASEGMEASEPILLQAHTDMVAEKNANVKHDFAREGIRLVQEGNILRANGTTLGADDGYGIAMILTVLDECTAHPALECLFTSSEETGMDGVMAFDYSHITARKLLNLDCGGEQEIICGCCGGVRTDLHLRLTREQCRGEGLTLALGGLCGGHSGEDIHKGRANALTLTAKLLEAARHAGAMRLVEVNGGDKSNAIPRECVATLWTDDAVSLTAAIEKAAAELKQTLQAPECDTFEISMQPTTVKEAYSVQDTERFLRLLSLTGGVMAWHPELENMPYTSRNVASVRTNEIGICVVVSHRSFAMEEIEKSAGELTNIVQELDGSVYAHNQYPGWESPLSSPFATAWQEAYTRVTGKTAHTAVVHAGLECGMIADHLPGLTAISVGPNIYDMHTPAERMELDSFERFYATLLEFLKNA